MLSDLKSVLSGSNGAVYGAIPQTSQTVECGQASIRESYPQSQSIHEHLNALNSVFMDYLAAKRDYAFALVEATRAEMVKLEAEKLFASHEQRLNAALNEPKAPNTLR